jgi:hypothetical protein
MTGTIFNKHTQLFAYSDNITALEAKIAKVGLNIN